MAVIFGIIGYFMKRYDWPTVPLLLGVILGPLMEKNLVQTSQNSGGDLTLLFHHPISMVIFAIAALVVAGSLVRKLVQRLITRTDTAPYGRVWLRPAAQPSGTIRAGRARNDHGM